MSQSQSESRIGIRVCVGTSEYPCWKRQRGASGKDGRTNVAFDFRGASAQKPIPLVLGKMENPAGVLMSGGVLDWTDQRCSDLRPQPSEPALDRQAGFTAARPAANFGSYSGKRYWPLS